MPDNPERPMPTRRAIREHLEDSGAAHRESRFRTLETTVTDVSSLLGVLGEGLEHPEVWVFRGQANWEWGLVPKLGRLPAGPFRAEPEVFAFEGRAPEDGSTDVSTLLSGWPDRAVFDDWRAEAVSLVPPSLPRPSTPIEWLAVGQHYGLATRFLDWSRNPLIGVYFAIRGPVADQDSDSALFALRGIRSLEPEFEADPWRMRGVRIWHPPSLVERIGRQSGVFTLHQAGNQGGSLDLERYAAELWYDDLMANDPFSALLPASEPMGLMLVKIRIAADSRASLLGELRLLGVDEFSAFPDLEGLCRAYSQGRFRQPAMRQLVLSTLGRLFP
jgi:hypothetical protein